MENQHYTIGDWVEFTNYKIGICTPQCGQIVALNPVRGNPEINGVSISYTDKVGNKCLYIGCNIIHIRPIPITEKMLVENGFERIEADKYYPAARYWWGKDGKRDGFMIEITPYNPPLNGVKFLTTIHAECSHRVGVNKIHNCDIEYVHQLQQAIRICGIEKEITL